MKIPRILVPRAARPEDGQPPAGAQPHSPVVSVAAAMHAAVNRLREDLRDETRKVVEQAEQALVASLQSLQADRKKAVDAAKDDIEHVELEVKAEAAHAKSEVKADAEHAESVAKADVDHAESHAKADVAHAEPEAKTELVDVRKDLKADPGKAPSADSGGTP